MFSNKMQYLGEIKLLLYAFMFACTLWFTVVGKADVESDMVVRIEYQSLPSDLVIAGDLVESLRVKVRATEALLRTASTRDLTYTVDLAGIERGANFLPIDELKIFPLHGLEILNVNPSYVVVDVDFVATKEVPIELDFVPMRNEDLIISSVKIEPSTVVVKGPTSALGEIDYLVAPFDLNLINQKGTYTRSLQLIVPEYLNVDAPVTMLSLDVEVDKVPVELSRYIIKKNIPDTYSVSPEKIDLLIDVPASRVLGGELDPAIGSQIKVMLEGSNLQKGRTVYLPVEVTVPSEVDLIDVIPLMVKVK